MRNACVEENNVGIGGFNMENACTGHRRLDSTIIYTHLVSFEADEYHHAASKTVKEACELIDKGFEYVTEQDGFRLWRRRK